MRGMLETLRQRGENGITSTVIPAGWNKVNLFIYTFAASADGTYSSPTVRSYPPPTAREIALAKVEQEWEDARLHLAILRNTATDEQLEAIDRAKKEEKLSPPAPKKTPSAPASPLRSQTHRPPCRHRQAERNLEFSF